MGPPDRSSQGRELTSPAKGRERLESRAERDTGLGGRLLSEGGRREREGYRDGEPDYQRTSSARDLASQRREHSRGGGRDGRERVEKRVRSDPSMHESSAREAGELVEEARPREKRSRRDRDAREGPTAIPPPPPRRGSFTPTRLPAPETGESRRGAATPPRLLNTLPAEIRQAALEAQQRDQARKAAAAKAAADEAAAKDNGKLAPPKHSPILWRETMARSASRSVTPEEPSSKSRADRGVVGRTAAEIAALELAEFQQRQGADVDPDAPAAMKASPSGSEDGGIPRPSAMEEDDAASQGQGATKGIRSRWQLDDEEEEAGPGAQANGVAEGGGAGSTAVISEEELEAGLRLADANGDANEMLEEELEEKSLFQLTRRPINMLNSCRKVDCFERLNRISEGTYGVVYRAKDKETGTICALKRIKMEKEKDGFPLTSIREINILLSFHHPNIVDVSEVVVGDNLDQVFMVMEFMEHDLKGLMEDMTNPFTVAETKNLMRQLLEGIHYLHDNWVLHRDLKTSNILYNNRGQLKICDFGLARQYGDPIRPYTHNVVTLYYRSIELLLGCKEYSTAVDMWSLGCIMAELLTKKVLFQGTGELDQIDRIFKVMGSPTEETWPGFKKLENVSKLNLRQQKRTLRERLPAAKYDPSSGLTEAGFDLLERMLALDPSQRISAEDALHHEWFKEHPKAKDNSWMPTFPTSKDGSSRNARVRTARVPSPDPRREGLGPNLGARAAEIAAAFASRRS